MNLFYHISTISTCVQATILLIYTCHIMIMANNNSFIYNTGLNRENSLTHLLYVISPEIENEIDLIKSSKCYDDKDFKVILNSINNGICIVSLNCQSINAKFEKLKLFLDDVNTQNPISVICIQESWGHEKIDIIFFSSKLHSYQC